MILLGLFLAASCARNPSADEAAVYSAALADLCSAAGYPLFVREDTDGLSLWPSSLDHLRRESRLVSPELFADFSGQRSSRVRLSPRVPLSGRCSYRSTADLDVYGDTSAAMQAWILPPPGSEPAPHASVLTLSPVGFDFSRDVAMVQRFWAGGYGLCMGEVLLLQKPHGRWTVVRQIGEVVC